MRSVLLHLRVVLCKEILMAKKLFRSRTDRMIWGICGGVARYLDVDPTVVRVIAVISLLFGTAGFWVYIIMRILVPEE